MTDSGGDERWQRQFEIFHAALSEESGERSAFVARECGEDDDLRRRVEALLVSHRKSSPLDASVGAAVTALAEESRAPSPPPPDVLVGEVVSDRFEIVGVRGSGGMGTVYEARDRRLGTTVALKVLRDELARNGPARARFLREINLARKVTHPNACRVFDLVEHGGQVFLTMELLEGETLADRLQRSGALPVAQAAPIVEQVARALDAAHAVDVVHRDLKPSNVMLVAGTDGERAVVTDFGLATTQGPPSTLDPGLTRSGQILGTPAYMSPEQFRGDPITPATDVYALGLLMYEMVTAHRPLEGTGPLSIAARRVAEPSPSPREHLPELDRRWEAAILRCLERRPEARFRRAGDVVEALRESSAERGPVPRRRRWRYLGLAAGLALVLSVALILFREASDPTPDASRSPAPPSAGESLGFQRQDAVLLAAFDDPTEDEAQAGALEASLAHELSSSPFVTVVGRRRIDDTLRLLRQPAGTRLDLDLARQVAQRDPGVRAVLSGSVRRTGEATLLTLSLIRPAEGTPLGKWSEPWPEDEAGRARSVRALARQVRDALGENLDQSDELSATGPGEVTTPSPRALRLFDQAEAIIARGRDEVSEELLREAIREDPEFASAHLFLAFALANQGRSAEVLPHAERAKQLADTQRLTDRETFFIRGGFFHLTGDEHRARANYEALLRLHPDHYWANTNLAVLLGPSRGIEYHVQKARYRPNDLRGNWDAAHALATIGDRPEEAASFVARIEELAGVGVPFNNEYEVTWARLYTAHRHWVRGDIDSMRAELDRWSAEAERMHGSEAASIRLPLAASFRAIGLPPPGSASAVTLSSWDRLHAGLDAHRRGDSEVARERLAPGDHWSDRSWFLVASQEPLRIAALARLGAVDEARRELEVFRRFPLPETFYFEESPEVLTRVVELTIAEADGGVSLGDPRLESLQSHQYSHYGPAFFLTVGVVANARAREEGPAAAAAYLLRATDATRGRSYPFGRELWLESRLAAAELYARAGQRDRAEPIVAELESLMRLAEPEFWLLARLADLDAVGSTQP